MIQLSICIATHNRANFLNSTLSTLINQITNECEIIIYDSASTDNTSEVVVKYSSLNSNIKYFFSEYKLGIDKDYNNCIIKSSGKFCWLFSDDDLVEDGCINYLLSKIKTNLYSIILLNSSIHNIDFSRKVANQYLKLTNDIEFHGTKNGNEEFFIKSADYLSFIGCVVIEREEWIKRNKERYFGSEFIHVGVIFQQLFVKKQLIISFPYIKIRLGNSQWYGRAFKIWIYNWPNLIWSFYQFSDESKSKIIPKYQTDQFFKLLYFRALGVYTFDDFKIFKFPNGIISIIKYYLIKFFTILPKFFTRLPYIVYAYIFKKEYMLRDLLKK